MTAERANLATKEAGNSKVYMHGTTVERARSDENTPSGISSLIELKSNSVSAREVEAYTRSPGAPAKLLSQAVTRRALGVNMMLGLGGLQGARTLTDRGWPPGPRKFAQPVVLQATMPTELWGTWLYQNEANAIVQVVEHLQLEISLDATGSLRYSRLETEYQTGCEAGVLAQWPAGNWATNGQQLVFTGPGTEDDRYTCNPAQNTTHSVGSRLVFSSYQVVGNTLYLDPYPAFPLTDISSTTDPTKPLHRAVFNKVVSPPTASWGNWVSLGGGFVDGCAVASWAPDRLDVFGIGGDRALYHRFRAGSTWSSYWERLEAYCIGTPAAVSWGPNRLDVFVIGGDRQCYHLYWGDHGWSGWEPLGGQCLYGCAAATWAPNQLRVYVVGFDQAIWGRSWNGNWSDWKKVDSTSISAPAAVAYDPNSFDLACIGPDHNLWLNEDQGSGFSGWINVGPWCQDGVAAASWGANRHDFFVTGSDGAVWQKTYDSGWKDWVSLGGGTNLGPAAVAPAPNRMEAVVIGWDNALWQRSYQ